MVVFGFIRVDNERLLSLYSVIVHSPDQSRSDIHHPNIVIPMCALITHPGTAR